MRGAVLTHTPRLKHSALLPSVVGVFGNIAVTFVIGAAANVLATRLLGPQERGVLAVSSLLASVVMTLADLGVRSAILYNVSRYADPSEGIREALAVSFYLLPIAIGMSAGVYALACLVGSHTFLRGVGLSLLIVSYSLCLLRISQDLATQMLVGVRDYRGRNMVYLIAASAYIAVVGIWYLTRTQMTAGQALAAQSAATLLASAFGFAYLVRRYRPCWPLRVPVRWKERYLTYGIKSMAALLASQANARLDTFVINALLSSQLVGFYSAGTSLAELTQQLTTAAATVLFPEIGQRKGSDRRRTTLLTVGSALYAVVLLSAALALALPWLLPTLYGSAFAPGIAAALWLLPGMAGLTIFRMFDTTVAALGKPEYRAYSATAGTAATVALDLVLVPRFGIVGAAWASSIAYTLSALFALKLYVHLDSSSLRSTIAGMFCEPISAIKRRLVAQAA